MTPDPEIVERLIRRVEAGEIQSFDALLDAIIQELLLKELGIGIAVPPANPG